VVVTPSPNLLCDLLSPPTSIDDVINDIITREVGEGELYTRPSAAIYVVRKSFEEDNSECLLLMDADNAFNKFNRKVSLENIRRLCPPMYTYLHNSYNTPAMLFSIWKMVTTYCHWMV